MNIELNGMTNYCCVSIPNPHEALTTGSALVLTHRMPKLFKKESRVQGVAGSKMSVAELKVILVSGTSSCDTC